MPIEPLRVRSTVSVQSPSHGLIWLAMGIALLALATFGPIYWLRLTHHDPNLTWLVQLHGVLMFGWIALLIVQTALIKAQRRQLHRQMGLLGLPLAAAMFVVGLVVVVHGAARQAEDAFEFKLMLVAFDGVNLLVFFGLVASALFWRRLSDYHRRLMLLATLCLLGPAFGRLTSIVNGFGADNDVAVLLLMLATLAGFVVFDVRRLHRIHPATLYGAGAVAVADFATYAAKLAL